MGPELWVVAAAVFVGGGAVGAAGTLLAQWVVGKVGGREGREASLESREARLLRAEVRDMELKLENVDARLDFQEQLLGGSLHPASPPPPLAPSPTEDDPA
jgi:hypothetical protein